MGKITVKDRILEKLSGNKNKYYSGQELAEELGVTRAAVWKAIETLRTAGYDIQGTTNKGYCIADESDVIDTANVTASLTEEARLFYKVECLETTLSTNLDVRNRAVDGAPEGLVIIAEEQTKGRGRMGRSFHSPKGSGIYLSVLLRPKFDAREAVQITVAAAAAAACAIEKVCPSVPKDAVKIKWVNDLYLNDRKICGILTEAAFSVENTSLEYAVLGIGFNVSEPEGGWPEDIQNVAGSLNGYDIPSAARVHIAAEFLNRFLPMYEKLTEHLHLEEYRRRQMLFGERIEIISTAAAHTENLQGIEATAVDIDDACGLVVRIEKTGELKHLHSGEVRVKKSK